MGINANLFPNRLNIHRSQVSSSNIHFEKIFAQINVNYETKKQVKVGITSLISLLPIYPRQATRLQALQICLNLGLSWNEGGGVTKLTL